jgi:hypothetical protein
MKGEIMIIERKFGELKDGEKFWAFRDSVGKKDILCVKDSNGRLFLSDDSTVFQLVSREEQIAALKAIEKPFSLWPEWLKTCEVFKELKDKEVWDWYSISCRWNCATIFYDDGNLVRLSPTYQDKEPEKPKEPKFTKHTISFELVEGEMKNLKFE